MRPGAILRAPICAARSTRAATRFATMQTFPARSTSRASPPASNEEQSRSLCPVRHRGGSRTCRPRRRARLTGEPREAPTPIALGLSGNPQGWRDADLASKAQGRLGEKHRRRACGERQRPQSRRRRAPASRRGSRPKSAPLAGRARRQPNRRRRLVQASQRKSARRRRAKRAWGARQGRASRHASEGRRTRQETAAMPHISLMRIRQRLI